MLEAVTLYPGRAHPVFIPCTRLAHAVHLAPKLQLRVLTRVSAQAMEKRADAKAAPKKLSVLAEEVAKARSY